MPGPAAGQAPDRDDPDANRCSGARPVDEEELDPPGGAPSRRLPTPTSSPRRLPMRVELDVSAATRYASGGVIVWCPTGSTTSSATRCWSYAPRVEPKVLTELSAAYPAEIGRYLEVVPDVRFPTFGSRSASSSSAALRERSFDCAAGRVRAAVRQAREVVEGAATPYVAVAALEAWFRSQGGFVYDETPPPYGLGAAARHVRARPQGGLLPAVRGRDGA